MRCRSLYAFALASIVAVAAGCSDSDDSDDAASSTDAAVATSSPGTTDLDGEDNAPVTSAAAGAATTAPGDQPAVCAELERIQVLSIRMQQVLAPAVPVLQGTDPAAGLDQLGVVADEMEAMLPEILDAYSDAAAVADDTIALDIQAVADATEVITPLMVNVFRSAESPNDVARLEQALSAPDVQAKSISGGEASLRLDEFTVPECGFKFSNS